MLFFPFRADIKLARFPIITLLICVSCLYIYWLQAESDRDLINYSSEFCEQQEGRVHEIVMKKMADANQGDINTICYSIFTALSYSVDKNKSIVDLTSHTEKFSTKSLDKSHRYIEKYLTKKVTEFESKAPTSLSNSLRYEPDSYNVLKMITSAFAHGSWSHVIGNLFFFFAFAATVEALLGLVFYPLLIIALAIGTNLVYSLSVMMAPESLPTLGLSGVVMGTMGMFTYLIPKAYIRCFFWFIIIVRKFGVPAWLLAMWYFGWDVYELYHAGTGSGVNLVAHVSGFIQGYLMGMLLFKSLKKKVHEELKRKSDNDQLNKVLSL